MPASLVKIGRRSLCGQMTNDSQPVAATAEEVAELRTTVQEMQKAQERSTKILERMAAASAESEADFHEELAFEEDEQDPIMASLSYIEAMTELPKKRPLLEEAKFLRKVQTILTSSTDTKLLKRLSPLLSARRRALMMKDEDYNDVTVTYFQNQVWKAIADKGTLDESQIESFELKSKIHGAKRKGDKFQPPGGGGRGGSSRGRNRQSN
ncbi:hypothetical protein J8273_6770 [Carpediemonas membranifera]|uniref:Uncharacterized protein n=1 Tax=Carpediemonas membranifera TaxID=201153 RepID=A0A8J6B0Y4_9EUKA|nr:hypothetical protein J8273_6770 [Carpediemonas membranifera]|eukprot:KAG9391924.1 hypothetical protein J8273_6770 [Carpediemonas membranifera]